MTTYPDETAVASAHAGAPAKIRSRGNRSPRKNPSKFPLPAVTEFDEPHEVVVEVISSNASVIGSNPGIGSVTLKITGQGVDARTVIAQLKGAVGPGGRSGSARRTAVALLTDVADELSEDSWEQAQRLAARHEAMVRDGALGHAELAEQKHVLTSSARTWVARQRTRSALFTVNYRGRTLVPRFQLDADLEPRPALRPVLRELRGLGSWQTWVWLTSPTSLLSGEVPEKLVDDQPDRVLAAAQRFAARWRDQTN